MNTLQKNCLLIALTVKMPGKGKTDRAATAKVIAEEHAAADAGKFVKKLYPTEALDACEKISNALRSDLYAKTLPWQDGGARLLPAAALIDLQQIIAKARAQFDAAAADSAARFDEWISAAQVRHNGMFKRTDYPTDAEHYRKQFAIVTTVLPLPDETNILCELTQAEIDAIKEDTARAVAEAAEAARADVLSRLRAPIAHAAETLAQPGKVFRNSLLSNIDEIAAAAAGPLNVTEDASIQALAEEARDVITCNPDILRSNQTVRQSAARRAAALLQKIDAIPRAE